MEIGGEPIVWHVIQIYAAQGLRRFLLCTGYKGELIEEFVASRDWPRRREVRCVDTGQDTPTGGPHQAGRASCSAIGRSAPPTPTAWPTSTSPS